MGLVSRCRGDAASGAAGAGGGSNNPRRNASVAVAGMLSLFMVGAVGGSVLTWWFLHFHPSNQHLWMAPVGLVMLVTPNLVILSLVASGPRGSSEGPCGAPEHRTASTPSHPPDVA